MTTSTVEVIPTNAALGADIAGFDINAMTEADFAVIRDAWLKHLVLRVRGQDFDDRQQGRSWCCHVHYEEIVRDPAGAMQRIYAHFGEAVQPLHGRRIAAWITDRGQEAFGRHVYSAEDFGFTEDQLAERYAGYRARYGIPLERTQAG